MSTPGSHIHRKENKHRAASASGARTHKRRSSAADEPELERKPPKAERKPLLAASPTKPSKEVRRAMRSEDNRDAYQGTLAVAEYERLKKENEALKKQLSEEKTVASKHRRLIESLKRDNHHRAAEVHQLKVKSQEDEEVISTFESNLTCSICLDTLLKPFALPPCGHVFCYSCLHDWFIRAPADDESMDEDDEDTVLRRRKSCPSCRGLVLSRPVPLFVVKSLAHALVKARPPDGPAKAASPPPSAADPWAGIFWPDAYTEAEGADDDDESESDSEGDGGEEDSEMADSDDDVWSEYGYGTGSDESVYEGEWVRARWAPPGAPPLDPAVYDLAALTREERALLRRGASLAMRPAFRLRYTHAHGLVAVLAPAAPERSPRVVHLGWNISLHPADPTGAEYMDWIRRDMAERRERWQFRRNADGTVSAWKLVRAEDAFAYDTSDSEAYEPGEA